MGPGLVAGRSFFFLFANVVPVGCVLIVLLKQSGCIFFLPQHGPIPPTPHLTNIFLFYLPIIRLPG